MLKKSSHNKPSRILETIGWILLSAYIMVLPIGHTVALRNLLFFTLTAITVWLALRNRIQICMPIIKPWLLYAAIAFISLTYAIDPWYSLGEIKTEIGFGFLVMILGATWVNSAERLTSVAWIIVTINAFLVASSFYYSLPLLTQASHIEVGGFNIGVGKFSTYIVLMLPLIVASWWTSLSQRSGMKLFLIILVAGNIAALYFTGNRAGLVALLAETIVLGAVLLKYHPTFLQGRNFWAILVLAVLFLGSLGIHQINNRKATDISISSSVATDPRWVAWHLAVRNIETRPITGGGFGLEAFKLLNLDYPNSNPTLRHAHNTVLNVGIQTGFPGMIAFIMLMASALTKMSAPLKKTRKWNTTRIYSAAAVAMFAGLAVKMQTDDFFNRDIALFFWLIIGALSFSTSANGCADNQLPGQPADASKKLGG